MSQEHNRLEEVRLSCDEWDFTGLTGSSCHLEVYHTRPRLDGNLLEAAPPRPQSLQWYTKATSERECLSECSATAD
eukprot:393287-Amphidinium_carterae.1